MSLLNLATLFQEKNDQIDNPTPQFDGAEIFELANLYAHKLISETLYNTLNNNQQFIDIKKLFKSREISTDQLNINTSQIAYEKILANGINTYLQGSLQERRKRELIITQSLEEVYGIKLSTARLLEELNTTLTNTTQYETMKKRLKIVTPVIQNIPTIPYTPIGISPTSIEVKPTISPEIYWNPLDMNILTPEIQNIMETLEIKGSLANIRIIKDKFGNIILKNTRKTSLAHKNILPDLIGLALEFYTLTGDPLQLGNLFRSNSEQRLLKEDSKKTGIPTNTPGNSWHNVGIAFDVKKVSRYHKKIGGLDGFISLAKKHNFAKISNEDRHFEHNPIRTEITREKRKEAATIMEKQYQIYRA